ncbi:MAG: hypothetical protein BGO68_04710 [Candidatus Amoebophilus sp. 36-38]|nr:MAG: hypothetical protein BGO68_04710 [Candidatus Amoebophilus sp. 36-38]
MALPDYIKPGLYINNLGKVTSENSIYGKQIPHSEYPQVNNILGIEGTKTFVKMSKYFCNVQVSGTETRIPGLTITTSPGDNAFLYIPQDPRNIAIGYTDVPLSTNMHIYSDNFGGCEWHVLSHNQDTTKTVAFLHVYKGQDKICQYESDGWERKAILYSTSEEVKSKLRELGKSFLNCSIVAYAFIDVGTTTVDTCMLILDNNGMVIGYTQHQEITI